MKTEWTDPSVRLPKTSHGERDEEVSRVMVEVMTSKNKLFKCQFRRREQEKGGAFCGFPGTIDYDRDGDVFSYGEYCHEWHCFGETSYHNAMLSSGKALDYDERITGWRYVNISEE